MFDVHYITQTEPFKTAGAALRVRRCFHQQAKNQYDSLSDETHYIYLEVIDVSSNIIGVNVGDSKFKDELLYLMVKDGIKMHGSILEFEANIQDFSPFLEDAYFEVQAESESYYGKFRIKDGQLLEE
ncbi:MAG: hypothetical protein JKY60_10835 [Kordiimonadaceae bacterium]|nr:hypothetical protein [Kordiimonadaceae bacterium]